MEFSLPTEPRPEQKRVLGQGMNLHSNTSAYVLFEHQVHADLASLDAAWTEPRTFVFVADRSGVPTEWIEQKLDGLPEEYRTGHFILLTSGSTGRPKLVVGRRDRAEALARLLHELQESEPVVETILALPLTYCYAFVNQWLWARQQCRRLVVTAGLAQPEQLRQALNEASGAMICLVGAQVPLLLQYFSGHHFQGIIRIHFAGGRFPQERLNELKALFPSAGVFNNYGCAEAMPRLTLRRAEAATVAHHVGWALPGIEMKSDEENRLLFRSPFGAVGLIDEGGLTRVEQSTWVPTGDLGCQAQDGHWEILGRQGEVFKRYGEKISLAQILTNVRSLWRGQADAYRETDRVGEAGFVLVLSPRPAEDELRSLLQAISQKHPRVHWPLRVESLPTMPLLANGKINREALGGNVDTEVHWKQRI